jgi:TonB family protein
MSAQPPQPPRWPLRRWAITTLIVFAGQLGCIFWLSASSQSRTRTVFASPPNIHLAASRSNLVLALNDPTLFALPHGQTFSGQAWLTLPNQTFESFVWSENGSNVWFDLNTDELGSAFRKALENESAIIPPPVAPAGERRRLPELPAADLFRTHSTLVLGPELAQRRLNGTFALRSWSHTDILTNSIVQVLVDAQGRTVSCTLLPPGSGLSEADQQAVALARAARFQPVRPEGPDHTRIPTAGLTLGQMIFQWHTLLLPDTNSPPRGN